jgi:hypothetical protein
VLSLRVGTPWLVVVFVTGATPWWSSIDAPRRMHEY